MTVSDSNMTMRLNLRTRLQMFKGNAEWELVIRERDFPVHKTAILLCDVWDDHWCKGASMRVAQMVPKMNMVVNAARENGVQIIHAPSGTLDFYADTSFRKRIQNVPRVQPPEELDLSDPPLPIDDSDGGCDTGDKPWHKAWTRQHEGIEIRGNDCISDDGLEVYSFMYQKGIENLIIMVRDLTDAMYTPKKAPYVSHKEGTQLVIEHIEKYWCPSILSRDLLNVHYAS